MAAPWHRGMARFCQTLDTPRVSDATVGFDGCRCGSRVSSCGSGRGRRGRAVSPRSSPAGTPTPSSSTTWSSTLGSLSIWEGMTAEEVRAIVQEDPFVLNGVFEVEEIADWTVYVDTRIE